MLQYCFSYLPIFTYSAKRVCVEKRKSFETFHSWKLDGFTKKLKQFLVRRNSITLQKRRSIVFISFYILVLFPKKKERIIKVELILCQSWWWVISLSWWERGLSWSQKTKFSFEARKRWIWSPKTKKKEKSNQSFFCSLFYLCKGGKNYLHLLFFEKILFLLRG